MDKSVFGSGFPIGHSVEVPQVLRTLFVVSTLVSTPISAASLQFSLPVSISFYFVSHAILTPFFYGVYGSKTSHFIEDAIDIKQGIMLLTITFRYISYENKWVPTIQKCHETSNRS